MRFLLAVWAFLVGLRKPALDLVERVGSTWVQAFVAALLVAGALDLGAVSSAALAGITAGLNLLLRLATAWAPTTANLWLEFVERVLVTFVASLLAALVAAHHYGLSDLRAASLAGVAAALVVAKAGLARLLGSSSASLLGVLARPSA